MFDPTKPNPATSGALGASSAPKSASEVNSSGAPVSRDLGVSVVTTEPAMAHADALPAGTKLGEFEILSLLGVGGFGMVYRAYDHSLHRTVAIKEYMPSAMAGRSQGLTIATRSSTDQQTLITGLRSFVSEARLLAQFDHPSLVKVYRFWEDNSTAYMSMPLYRGLTLRQARALLLSPPSEDWLRTVLWAILGALKYLHEHNIVHRDVSPDNIFLQDLGPPVLLDLGAARRTISDSSQKHTAILKVNYAPIEQYAGAGDMRQGPWTDLYSIAAVVHGCLCNEPPPPATFRVLRDRMPSFASVAKTVESHFGHGFSPEFIATIEHAMAIQPQNRPQSVQEFSEEMGLQPPKDIQRFAWAFGLPLNSTPVPPTPAQAVSKKSETTFADTQLTVDMSDVPERTVLMQPDAQASQPGRLAVINPANLGQRAPIDLIDDMPPMSELEFPATGDPVVAALTAKAAPKRRKVAKSSAKTWVFAALGCVALVGIGVWKMNATAPVASLAGTPASVTPARSGEVPASGPGSETVIATLPAPLASAVANTASASEAAGSAKPDAATPQANLTIAAATPPSARVSAAASAPAGVKKPGTVSPKPTTSVSAATRVEPGSPASARSEVAVKEAEARPEPVVAAAPARPAAPAPARAGPQELCANAGFLARPMCVFNECEKPEFSRLAFCVANRKALQDSTRNQQQ